MTNQKKRDALHTEIKIRDVIKSEASDLSELALRSKAYWGYSPEFMEECTDELTFSAAQIESAEYIFKAAEDSQKILGFYALQKIDNSRFELEALFVDPDHMGIKVGTALIEDAKKTALQQGALSIHIQSDPNAETFYKNAGAINIGQRESGSISGRFLPLLTIDLH